jgi:hypothetical protein
MNYDDDGYDELNFYEGRCLRCDDDEEGDEDEWQ